MRFLALLTLSAVAGPAMLAAPVAASAPSPREHVSVPAGKLHARSFRPLDRSPCGEARLNPSGSRIATTLPARSAEACRGDRPRTVAAIR